MATALSLREASCQAFGAESELLCGEETADGFMAHMDSLTPSSRSERKSRKFLKSLTRKEPFDLLLVIGTGVSAAVAPYVSALRSWRSCIEAVIEAADDLEVLHPCDVAEFRKKAKGDRDLLVVAHDLIRKMSPRTGDTKPNFFQDCLMEVFENLDQHIQNPMLLDAILQLMEGGTMVLTTNYDNLLEIFGLQRGKPMESVDLKEKEKVVQWARGLQKYSVLHIHGLYTDPCGLVLDPSGYKDVMQDQDLMDEFQNLYRTKSFVFLGCGETLRDQIFQALFLYTVPNKMDLEHYMLVRKDSEDYFFKLQAEMLLHGIKVVSYGDQFHHMPEYFRDLVALICKQRIPDGISVDSTNFLLGTSCSDCAKRRQEENGCAVEKKARKANDAESGAT
ncbi:protein FAM118A isoform X2 [Callorhinchus milii]|uniref:Family with sequence similarity 118 member A n=2 Tax=Callorhinchus milii TaxID=7868 RepID=A0A4W3IST3_CALMI|nr:protein FAM118A isoform X2 [Callorhinchus milii]|eukprot:gi/632954311/ref/XP_007892890.1/ PREDICTED: protein FAM118A isoform X2 [Callorhinchus milii]